LFQGEPETGEGEDVRVEHELEGELQTAAAACGCELVHAEFKGGTLRLVIDREGGVTLDDCAAVSRQASAQLDAVDFGRARYVLEVSSPGLDRELYSSRDWERFVGRRLRVTFSEPESGRKRTVTARLEAFDAMGRRAALVEADRGEALSLELDRVIRARLEPEI
jgi:ribosome maturation factor RimP